MDVSGETEEGKIVSNSSARVGSAEKFARETRQGADKRSQNMPAKSFIQTGSCVKGSLSSFHHRGSSLWGPAQLQRQT